jgi:TatA/E family protein of Tat protein translocase
LAHCIIEPLPGWAGIGYGHRPFMLASDYYAILPSAVRIRSLFIPQADPALHSITLKSLPLQIGELSYCEKTMNPFHPAFIQGIGGPELLIILVIILLLFGAKKLPELAKGLGKSMKEFKKAAAEVQEDFQEAMDAVEEKPKPAKPAVAKPAATKPAAAPVAVEAPVADADVEAEEAPVEETTKTDA